MASQVDHLDQAEHNEEFAKSLTVSTPIPYRDWVEIAAFYSAVHYVEAYYDGVHGKHSEKQQSLSNVRSVHEFRVNMVKKYLSTTAATAYIKLYRTSKMLRYLETVGTRGSWLTDDDTKGFVDADLAAVKQEVKQKLAAVQAVTP